MPKSGKVLVQFWKGGESLRARARATCSHRGNEVDHGIRAGGKFQSLLTESATENKPPPRFGAEARVKRWSKSPPLRGKSRRHGKPHREQGQIGDDGIACSTTERSKVSGTGCLDK